MYIKQFNSELSWSKHGGNIIPCHAIIVFRHNQRILKRLQEVSKVNIGIGTLGHDFPLNPIIQVASGWKFFQLRNREIAG